MKNIVIRKLKLIPGAIEQFHGLQYSFSKIYSVFIYIIFQVGTKKLCSLNAYLHVSGCSTEQKCHIRHKNMHGLFYCHAG